MKSASAPDDRAGIGQLSGHDITTGFESEGAEPAQPLLQFVGCNSFLTITGLFWLYVTLSNLMYARSMQVNMAMYTPAMVFSPWGERGLQHLLLFPILLACYWTSLRVGWRSYLGASAQLGMGITFASVAYFAMDAAEVLYTAMFYGKWHITESGLQGAVFVTYFTTFFLTYGFGLGLITGFALYRRFHASEVRVSVLRREWSSGAAVRAAYAAFPAHALQPVEHHPWPHQVAARHGA